MHLSLHNTSCLPQQQLWGTACLSWPLILLQPPLDQRHHSGLALSQNNSPKQKANITPKTIQQNTAALGTKLLSNARAAGKGVWGFWAGRISGQLQEEHELSLWRNCCQWPILLFWSLKTHRLSGGNACTAFASFSWERQGLVQSIHC